VDGAAVDKLVDLVVVDEGRAEADGQPGAGVDDEPDARVGGVAGDLVGQCAAFACAIAEDHVDVGGSGDAEADAVIVTLMSLWPAISRTTWGEQQGHGGVPQVVEAQRSEAPRGRRART
jgi:hypothetical protein